MHEAHDNIAIRNVSPPASDGVASAGRSRVLAEICGLFARRGPDLQLTLEAVAHRVTDALGDECHIRLEPGYDLRSGSSKSFDSIGRGVRYVDRIGPTRSLVMPIQARGALLGTIVLWREDRGRSYSPDEEGWLEHVAEQVAVGIDYALLSETAAIQSEHMQAILDATKQIVGPIDLDSVLLAILDRIVELASADTASIWVVDDAGIAFSLKSLRGLDPAPGSVSRCEGLVREAIQTGKAVYLADCPDDAGRNGSNAVGGGRAVIAVPLRRRQEAIGALLAWSRPSLLFTAAQEVLIGGLSELAALAMTQARAQVERGALEQQFLQSQKMEAIGRLAGGVAHDFNNLLTTISGFGELTLLRANDPNAVRDYVAQILQAGERAASLTRQLLVVSRRQPAQPKVLDLNALVSDLERMLRRLIPEDVELVTKLDPGLGRVEADPSQLEQVVVNLVVNARDAMSGGGRLVVETSNADLREAYTRTHLAVRPGHYVCLAVSDTGTGIDVETLKHIFEPFFTTKAPGSGTGLGLSTVYGIVKQSGGDVWVYSEVNRGTTFKIYLPHVKTPTATATIDEVSTELPRGTETILVIEDEERLRLLATLVLQSSGYTVLEAPQGEVALQVAESHTGPIHLLLTDVVMPGLTARQVVDGLRARHPGLKILFMSGYTDDILTRSGLANDNVAFLEKPFTPSLLTRKVRAVLDVAPSGR